MRHITPFFFLSALTATAQLSFNQAHFTPTMGSQPVVGQASTYIAPGPATAGFVFDTGAFTVGEATGSEVVSPGSTPYAATFPQATHATTTSADPSAFNYSRIDATGVYTLGTASPDVTLLYTDPERVFPIPLAYNTTWNDPWSSTVEVSGFETTTTGTTAGVYNGHGTIVLPWGSFPAARVQVTQNSTAEFMGQVMMTMEMVTVHYIGLVNSKAFPLLTSTTVTVTSLGTEPQVQQFSSALDPTALGIAEVARTLDAVLFPNPAHDQATLRLGASLEGRIFLTLFDVTGRAMHTQMAVANGASQDVPMDLSRLAAGRYILQVTDEQGMRHTMPLQVQ